MLLQDQSGLAQGISQAGSALASALGQALNKRAQMASEKAYGGILEEELAKMEGNAPQDFQSVLTRAIARGVPFEQAMKYGNLYGTLERSAPKTLLAGKTPADISAIFQKFGMDKETADRNADLYTSMTQGGQTKFAEMLIDQIQRGNVGGPNLQPQGFQQQDGGKPPPEVGETPMTKVETEMMEQREADNILRSSDVGLKPVERIRREDKRYNSNLKTYEEWNKKIGTAEAEKRRIDSMEKLNASDKLPKGIGRLNVDSMGNLRFPFLSSKESQKYQKLINEFVQGAKDSFGARVTNFEVDIFLKRLPTLLNSKEGRAAVLKQMKIVNELNRLYEGGRIEGIKKGGGLRKIDIDQATEYSLLKNKQKIADLEAEYRALDDGIEGVVSESRAQRKPLESLW